MRADRLTEMPTDAPTSSRKEEENKAIVDRWLTKGKSYKPAIVDELAALNIFFNHSLYTPRVALCRSRHSWRNFGKRFPMSVLKKGQSYR